MADDTGLQLLSERQKKITVATPGENKYVTASIVLLLVVAAAFGGLYFYRTSLVNSINVINGQLQSLENQRDKNTEAKLLSVSQRLAVINSVLSSRTFWTLGLSKLENLTEPQVTLESLTARLSSQQINFKALAPNYQIVAQQLASFLNDKAFTGVSLDKVQTQTGGRVEFDVTLSFKQNVLLSAVTPSPSPTPSTTP